jgi:alpha-L-fucosidase
MKNMLLLFLVMTVITTAGFSGEDEKYVPETDPLVLEKLEQWQDMKFGLLMHWGTYSQWGIVESWSICPEDYGWCERTNGSYQNYFDYVKDYENLKNTFNPVGFDPEKWAEAAKNAGMKYVVFTTKHHDGFCMFDSEFTDYKITDPGCPFSNNPKADVTGEIFSAFRNQGLWTGAYFSKPDWHCDDYWDPYFPPMDRNVNYDPAAYPEKWEKYVQFTHNQIMELCTDYDQLDILWLDGGWVQKVSDEELYEIHEKRLENLGSGFVKTDAINQDIRMDQLVNKARKQQPGLIVVDRAVHGKNQNYLTPENRVPEAALPYPWESCIIAGGGWSWTPDATYMSGKKLVHMLVDIVAKGGNLLLNIAPGPEGQWHDGAYTLLEEMGDWLNVNGVAIYETRAIAPYKSGNICFTKAKDGSIYAIYLGGENEIEIPETITIPSFPKGKTASVELIGSNIKLDWKVNDQEIILQIPGKIRRNPPCKYAWAFKISYTD